MALKSTKQLKPPHKTGKMFVLKTPQDGGPRRKIVRPDFRKSWGANHIVWADHVIAMIKDGGFRRGKHGTTKEDVLEQTDEYWLARIKTTFASMKKTYKAKVQGTQRHKEALRKKRCYQRKVNKSNMRKKFRSAVPEAMNPIYDAVFDVCHQSTDESDPSDSENKSAKVPAPISKRAAIGREVDEDGDEQLEDNNDDMGEVQEEDDEDESEEEENQAGPWRSHTHTYWNDKVLPSISYARQPIQRR
ncbi:hypothetical protein BOTBODRAFT_182368 [Botryobasidium botryosum FD-172 SS1]|uniref:Uncharacterized protein n=1 Tax=Botryobasidium botryosum (strain FD-172 SS1) TaxID=930990 RepID=A0A067LTT3_BOTB1|nr:hypothetical protein BOTBODRAFT_182368 [Botryobasidium botryosum FD-172 SS1]